MSFKICLFLLAVFCALLRPASANYHPALRHLMGPAYQRLHAWRFDKDEHNFRPSGLKRCYMRHCCPQKLRCCPQFTCCDFAQHTRIGMLPCFFS